MDPEAGGVQNTCPWGVLGDSLYEELRNLSRRLVQHSEQPVMLKNQVKNRRKVLQLDGAKH